MENHPHDFNKAEIEYTEELSMIVNIQWDNVIILHPVYRHSWYSIIAKERHTINLFLSASFRHLYRNEKRMLYNLSQHPFQIQVIHFYRVRGKYF